MAKNFPTMNAGALLPPRPLCFPTGSQATLDFRPRPYAPSTGVASSGMTVANAQSNGNNMRFDMKRTSGKIISPVPLTTPSECNGIYVSIHLTCEASIEGPIEFVNSCGTSLHTRSVQPRLHFPSNFHPCFEPSGLCTFR